MVRRGPGSEGDTLVDHLESFSQELLREAYLVGAGRKARGDEARIYRRWRTLFLPSAWSRLPSGPPRTRARLEEFLKVGYVDRAVAPWQDRRRNRLLRSTVLWEGRKVPFFSASVQLAELPRREDRRALYGELAKVWRSVAEEEEGVWATFQEGTRSLGFSDGRAASEALFHYGIPRLLRETRRFASSTLSIYAPLLRERAEAEGLAPKDLRTYDAGRLLRGMGWSASFPKDGLVPFLRRFLRGTGLPWGVFRPDLEVRPRKNPRAFCAPVRVPEEVYLVLRPTGGYEDYHTALHEMGHALHFGLTDPALDPVFRRLGDASLTEGWAFVLDLLFLNPSFVRTSLHDREFVRFVALAQIWMLRRYAGKIAYESRFFRDPTDPSLRSLYVRSLQRTTLVRPDEEGSMADRWRSDVDPWMYTAAYLRAWMFAGAFTELLERRWGERWWSRREAGAFLARLWSHGLHPTVEELSEEFGLGALSLLPLERLVRRALGD
ncbi:MAG: hypothetical protein KGI98_06920 [Euryarchaeota archaeon]|nr:hypothetical protein [Euryarchaeota archaeon]